MGITSMYMNIMVVIMIQILYKVHDYQRKYPNMQIGVLEPRVSRFEYTPVCKFSIRIIITTQVSIRLGTQPAEDETN